MELTGRARPLKVQRGSASTPAPVQVVTGSTGPLS